MTNDGMKKWLAYRSLDKQDAYLKKMLFEKGKREKPTLSPEEEEEINEKLTNYHHEKINIIFYENGYLYREEGKIAKIDTIYKYIKINDKKLFFDSLVSIR